MAILFVRTLIFYLLTVFSLRIMGKRQIGELEPTELVVTILVSELATLPMQDIDIPIIYTIIPIFALVAFEMLSAMISLKSAKFSSCLSGEYSVIINNGELMQKELMKSQLTMEELMEKLRLKGALKIEDVRFCILETSGKMSILLQKDTPENSLPVPLIVDGEIIKKNVAQLNLNLKRILKKENIKDASEVFWMVSCDEKITLIKKIKS